MDTANNVEVWNKQKIGTVFNATFEDNKLKAEAWLIKERVRNVDSRVSEAIASISYRSGNRHMSAGSFGMLPTVTFMASAKAY